MNLNFRKTALLAGICSVFSLGYAPQLFAVSSTDTVEAVQQTKKITGVVSDAMGPIIGANVLEKGTTNGVITDIDGNFALNVKPGATIVVSFIGYVSQEIKITNQTTVNITLKEDSEMLDEVVVVGYGTMKKSDLSGASVSMSEDKIKGSIITNLDQSLQGRAAGVTAVSTSGAPGSSSSIRVRGQATINANAEPLYVIDGVIVQSQGQSGSSYGLGDALGNGSVSTISPLSTINPADIVSMEILKDASATAIYGAQGSNGVVLITTKRGKAGEAKFTFGWTNTFRYKNFDLSVFINGSYGNKVYNYLSMKLTHMNSPWTNQLNAVNGRAQLVPINPNKVYEDGTMWYNDVSNVMVANPGASIPRATINDPNDNDRISDRYIEDGSYIRLKNISLGYTFPKKTIDKLGLSNLRIYANIQNLLTITGYDGYDPEIGASTSSVNVYGLDNGRYPSPTVYSFGLNVSF